MLIKSMMAMAVASLAITPALAAPTTRSTNPAASLSVAKSLRAGQVKGRHNNELAGGGVIVAIVAAAAVVAGIVIVADNGNNAASN